MGNIINTLKRLCGMTCNSNEILTRSEFLELHKQFQPCRTNPKEEYVYKDENGVYWKARSDAIR